MSQSPMNTELLKQWQLKNNSIVELPDGTRVTFVKMDGMYAKWNQNGGLKTGNFNAFEETDFGYKVIEDQS